MLDTILFDLDGTLVPFFQEDFIRAYFATLVGHMAPLGFDGKKLVDTVWKGTRAMMANDGAVTNRQLFWEIATREMGIQAMSLESHMDDFYRVDFDSVRSVLREEVDRGPLLRDLRERGYRLILATTPLFPRSAVETRLRWVGLTAEDFQLVTSYEDCRHSKPDVRYYADILQAAGVEAKQCVMVGNDPVEDMAAFQVGMTGYLVTDYLEDPTGVGVEKFPHGKFSEVAAALERLPAVR